MLPCWRFYLSLDVSFLVFRFLGDELVLEAVSLGSRFRKVAIRFLPAASGSWSNRNRFFRDYNYNFLKRGHLRESPFQEFVATLTTLVQPAAVPIVTVSFFSGNSQLSV